MADDREIIVNEDGSVSFIYDDALAEAFSGDESETRRASHVEPVRHGWTADMAPIGGPVLGPFTTRQAALDAEVAWIKAAMARGPLAQK